MILAPEADRQIVVFGLGIESCTKHIRRWHEHCSAPADMREDRILGVLLGTAIGDAIGLPYEGCRQLGSNAGCRADRSHTRWCSAAG